MLKTSADTMRIEFNIDPSQTILDLSGRFVPHSKAPVVVCKDNKNTIRMMNFSLVPSWSKTPKVKFATYNARLDTILEKPTWRGPFVKKHCLVPITDFIESITEVGKQLAGNMVRIHEQSNGLMVAAGIYDEWVNKDTGEIIESFAILTDEPPAAIAEIGHDRCPVFIEKKYYQDWLNFTGDGKTALALLKQGKRELQFATAIDRPLKAGWENRK